MNNIRLETYKVETGLFPEITNEDNDDSISIPYPEKIVRAWYTLANPGRYINGCKGVNDPCMEWVNNYYMISDISDLYRYAKEQGCVFEKHNTTSGFTWITVEYRPEEEETPMNNYHHIKIKERRTITLDEGALWSRVERDLGEILGKIYEELGVTHPFFEEEYEDDRHEAISMVTNVFKYCISTNMNNAVTEVIWTV